MFRQFRDALNWAQALDRYARTDFEQAVAKLEAIEGPRGRMSEYLALLGSAYIGLGMPDTGRALMVQAKDRSSPKRQDYRRYINAYCDYYISNIDGKSDEAALHLQTALSVSAPSVIRQWLPLS